MSLVQVAKSALTVSGTTQTTPAIGTTAGNCLLFFAAYSAINAGTATPSDSTSLTWVPVPGSPFSGSATGLQLACWIAANITGNAVNAFTLATTGADTPTIFIAEFAGRSKTAPLDVTATASDATASAGAHTTGNINLGATNDDVIAFNVSSAIAQGFTAGASWTIPPNGSNTASLGYDAFVQYRNNVVASSRTNAYSVALLDQLDGFMVGLQVPTQPYSDEWLDYFDEVPEIDLLEYSTADVLDADVITFIADIHEDWNNEADDTDVWAPVESASAVVIPNITTSAAAQYFGDNAELYDEALDQIPSIASYQQQDIAPLLCLEDAWDHFVTDDDDQVEPEDVAVIADVSPTYVDDAPYDWDEVLVDFFPDDFGNDDADLPVADGWTDWDAEELDNWAMEDDRYISASITPTIPTIEDAWDHFAQDEDEYATPDDWLGADNNPVVNVEDLTWWDEEPDQIDFDWAEASKATSNNNPVITAEDPWDHWSTDDDDYLVVDDFAIVDVVVNAKLTAEDPWDHMPTDDDDYYIVDEYPLVTLVPNRVLSAEDPWNHFVTDDDDYLVVDEVLSADGVAPSAQYPVEDAWDHFTTDDDDYYVNDDVALVDNTPTTTEDPWDHFAPEPEEDYFYGLGADPVAPRAVDVPEDAWDHFAPEPEEDYFYGLDPGAIAPPPPIVVADAWDHFNTDSDDYPVIDDYALIDVAVVVASMPVEDAWVHFETDVEDNDCDFGVVDNQLLAGVYETNPEFVVYLLYRPFTAIWLPEDEG
jgi:hypothetical protein